MRCPCLGSKEGVSPARAQGARDGARRGGAARPSTSKGETARPEVVGDSTFEGRAAAEDARVPATAAPLREGAPHTNNELNAITI